MSQEIITQPCYGAMHEINCHLFIYAAPGATRRNLMKNLNLQVTLLVQKGVGTRSHTFPPHYTPGYKRISQSELLHFRQEDISQNLAETSLSPWL